MTVGEIVRNVVQRLEAVQAEYHLVGAMAYFLYGPVRFTSDVDFVVSMSAAALDRVLGSLPPGYRVEPQARMELFTGTMRWVVGIADGDLKLEFFLLGNDPHHLEEFQRRRRCRLSGAEVDAWVATAEDLIIQKLRWSRPKDVEDIRGILFVQRDALDFTYIRRWTDVHGTSAKLAEIRASLPPDL